MQHGGGGDVDFGNRVFSSHQRNDHFPIDQESQLISVQSCQSFAFDKKILMMQ